MRELARAAPDDLSGSRAGRESTGFTRTCPACGRVGGRPLGVVNALPVGLCRGCRTVFVSSIPAVDDAQYYDAYYHEGNLEVPSFVDDRLEDLAASLERYRVTGRWLDVGFGAGALMRAAATRGWRVTGTEVSHGAVDAARAQEFDVMHGELGELRLGAGSFDVVSMVRSSSMCRTPPRCCRMRHGCCGRAVPCTSRPPIREASPRCCLGHDGAQCRPRSTFSSSRSPGCGLP